LLEESSVDLASEAGVLQRSLGIPQRRLHVFRDVLRAAPSPQDLAVALRGAAALQREVEARQPRVEVAWTFPGTVRPGLRTTGGVARDVISAARSSLLIVGYSVTVDPALAGLAAQTVTAVADAANRGVVVTAVLHRAANREALIASWRVGVSLPRVFTWPEADDPMAAVHAKVLIADRADALVTSANLTYHGFERNLEMGIRITGRAAAEMDDRIHELIAHRELVPWEEVHGEASQGL
jgi:cardiolipin synthase A/B